MRRMLLIEMIVIGLVTLIVSLGISRLLSGKFTFERNMLLGSFLVGAVLHFGFEIAGLNESWCRATYK